MIMDDDLVVGVLGWMTVRMLGLYKQNKSLTYL